MLRLGDSAPIEPDAQVFLHGEQPEDATVFRNPGDALAREVVGGHPGDAALLEGDLALGGSHEPHDRLERGGLADAVAAEQSHYLARLDLEGDTVQDVRLSVEGVNVVQAQHQVLR